MVTSGVGGFWTWRAGGGLATASSWKGRGPGLRPEPGSRGCGRRCVGGPVAMARAGPAVARDWAASRSRATPAARSPSSR